MKLDFQDRHLTPAAPEPRPGVIFQARVAEALASGKTLYDPGWLLSSLGPALFAFILLAFCLRLASVSRTIVSGAAVLAATGIFVRGLSVFWPDPAPGRGCGRSPGRHRASWWSGVISR